MSMHVRPCDALNQLLALTCPPPPPTARGGLGSALMHIHPQSLFRTVGGGGGGGGGGVGALKMYMLQLGARNALDPNLVKSGAPQMSTLSLKVPCAVSPLNMHPAWLLELFLTKKQNVMVSCMSLECWPFKCLQIISDLACRCSSVHGCDSFQRAITGPDLSRASETESLSRSSCH